MRHDLAAGSIAPCPIGVGEAPGTAALVATSGRALGLAPRLDRAVTCAVDLAAIAAPAHEHLRATARAQEHPRRLGHRRHPRSRPTAPWTRRMSNAILASASEGLQAPRCGARRRDDLPVRASSRLLRFGTPIIGVPLTSCTNDSGHPRVPAVVQGGTIATETTAGLPTANRASAQEPG